jgi:hypothetical protein
MQTLIITNKCENKPTAQYCYSIKNNPLRLLETDDTFELGAIVFQIRI